MRLHVVGCAGEMGLKPSLSPVSLLRLLLQAGQQADEAVVVALQRAGGQLAEVRVVLLVKQREGQVAAGANVLQDEPQHLVLHRPLELSHQPGQQLHANLCDVSHRRKLPIRAHVMAKSSLCLPFQEYCGKKEQTWVKHVTVLNSKNFLCSTDVA